MNKLGLLSDFKWYEKSGFFYPVIFSYYLLNFLSSWASVPFNILIVMANFYHSSLSPIDEELDNLKEQLYLNSNLTKVDVFTIYHLTDKNISPSIIGEVETLRLLSSIAKDYQFSFDEQTLRKSLSTVLNFHKSP